MHFKFDHKLAACSTKASGKIIEYRLATNDKLLLGLEAFGNGSYGISSSYFTALPIDPIIFNSTFITFEWSTIEIELYTETFFGIKFISFVITRLVDCYDDETGLTTPNVPTHKASRTMLPELLTLDDKRIRIYKYNDQTILKNFFYFKKKPSQLLVVLSNYFGQTHKDVTYGFIGTDEKRAVKLDSPPDTLSQHKYTYTSLYAVLHDTLFIFGGNHDKQKIAWLDQCEFTELPTRLLYSYESMISAALAVDGGSSGF